MPHWKQEAVRKCFMLASQEGWDASEKWPYGISSQGPHVLRQSPGLGGDLHRLPVRQGGVIPLHRGGLRESLGTD